MKNANRPINWEKERRLYRPVAGHPTFDLYKTSINAYCDHENRIEHNWENQKDYTKLWKVFPI